MLTEILGSRGEALPPAPPGWWARLLPQALEDIESGFAYLKWHADCLSSSLRFFEEWLEVEYIGNKDTDGVGCPAGHPTFQECDFPKRENERWPETALRSHPEVWNPQPPSVSSHSSHLFPELRQGHVWSQHSTFGPPSGSRPASWCCMRNTPSHSPGKDLLLLGWHEMGRKPAILIPLVVRLLSEVRRENTGALKRKAPKMYECSKCSEEFWMCMSYFKCAQWTPC